MNRGSTAKRKSVPFLFTASNSLTARKTFGASLKESGKTTEKAQERAPLP